MIEAGTRVAVVLFGYNGAAHRAVNGVVTSVHATHPLLPPYAVVRVALPHAPMAAITADGEGTKWCVLPASTALSRKAKAALLAAFHLVHTWTSSN